MSSTRMDSTRRSLRGRTSLVVVSAAAGAAAVMVPAVVTSTSTAAPTAQTSTPSPSPTCKGPAPQTLTGIGKNDRGPKPAMVDIHRATTKNTAYRDTLWTGNHLQLTVMSIKPKDDIGLEAHPSLDQFLRIEKGQGIVKMGPSQKKLNFVKRVNADSAIFVPAGTWHDVVNTSSRTPLKVYSIYAPPNHPRATLHRTKTDAAKDPLEKIKCPQDLEPSVAPVAPAR